MDQAGDVCAFRHLLALAGREQHALLLEPLAIAGFHPDGDHGFYPHQAGEFSVLRLAAVREPGRSWPELRRTLCDWLRLAAASPGGAGGDGFRGVSALARVRPGP